MTGCQNAALVRLAKEWIAQEELSDTLRRQSAAATTALAAATDARRMIEYKLAEFVDVNRARRVILVAAGRVVVVEFTGGGKREARITADEIAS